MVSTYANQGAGDAPAAQAATGSGKNYSCENSHIISRAQVTGTWRQLGAVIAVVCVRLEGGAA